MPKFNDAENKRADRNIKELIVEMTQVNILKFNLFLESQTM